MERLILLSIRRQLEMQGFCFTMIETLTGAKFSDMFEKEAKSYLKAFCKRQNLKIEYLGGNNYEMSF